MRSFHQHKAFTLIEMLIAISIGAGISVMAYSALNGALKAEEKVKLVTGQIDEIDRLFQYLSNDLLFAVPRFWVNSIGVTKPPLLGVFGDRLSQSEVLIASEDEYLLQFVRGNRENLLNKPRSNLYMVGFRLTQEEGSEFKSLWRDNWTPVDGRSEPKLQQRLLVDGIEDVSLSYLPTTFNNYEDQFWLTGWPSNSPTGLKAELPAAVKIKLTLSSLGQVERVFLLSGYEL